MTAKGGRGKENGSERETALREENGGERGKEGDRHREREGGKEGDRHREGKRKKGDRISDSV